MNDLGKLGLGTAPIAGLYHAVDDETADAVVECAWELGIRYFDTAPRYGAGLAERRLGHALLGKPRDAFAVSTKVGRLLRPGESVWHGAPPLVDYFDFSYDAALRSLEESLERLGLDRVDIAFVHDPDGHYEEALTGAFRALRRLHDEGTLRAIGVGSNQTEILGRFAREADPDCVLIAGRWTLLDRSAADELLPLCQERGITVIAGGVFNSGILAGGDSFDYERAPIEIVAQADRLRTTCAGHGVPLAAAAVQFPLRHPAVDCALIGCATADEMTEDVRLANLRLPDTLWKQLT
jgi:D-threo-aldose 1-dehydrogenase